MDLLNIWHILLYIINIVVLFLFLKHFVHKPVTKYLEARRKRIADELDNAEKKLAEADAAKEKYDRFIAESQNESAAIVAKGRDRAEQVYNDAVLKGKEEAREIVARAARDVDREKRAACEGLRDDIANMAVEIAGKVLQREVSIEDNRKIIDDFFEKVG